MPNEIATRPNQAPAERKPGARILDIIGGEKARKQFAMALPKHITVDLLLRITMTCVNKNPKLAECTPETFFGSIMDLAQMGLVPDGRNAYLVPFWNGKKKVLECQYIVGYQGFIELAYRHPLVKGIRFAAVHAKDYFDFEDGLQSRLVHRRSDDDDPGELTHAWAVCELDGGGRTFVVVNKRDVSASKKMARDAESAYSPWQVHPAAMWAKTAVRALAKRMPRSAELIAAIDADDKQANAQAIELEVPSGTIGGDGVTAIDDAAKQLPPQGETAAATTESNAQSDAPGKPPETSASSAAGDAPPHTTGEDSGAAAAPSGANTGPSIDELRKEISSHLAGMNIGKTRLIQQLVDDGTIPKAVPFNDIPKSVLQMLSDSWDDFKDKLLPK